ncbi:hypothetical protein [Synoicihabitans lomoniglobus]|uniref:Uncharacterized protein n=1 Tax=Synoicihabitans lomoniglobus TaxID=2909285 RepID=A0AAF0CMB6_9BACT|nr:hypothetical protein [Opitutaceae bacterium LMO-M01]WED63066.1 hypothetical protein PXH66_12060 [Opitutaceae bacterium LMO-M01]
MASAQSALFSPGSNEVSATYSFSSHADLKQAGTTIGDMEIAHDAFEYGVRGKWNGDTTAFGSISWSYDDLNANGCAPSQREQ